MMKWLRQWVLVSLLIAPYGLLHATEPSINTQEEYQSLITLFFAAARTGNNEVVEEFLAAGFPINQLLCYNKTQTNSYQYMKKSFLKTNYFYIFI